MFSCERSAGKRKVQRSELLFFSPVRAREGIRNLRDQNLTTLSNINRSRVVVLHEHAAVRVESGCQWTLPSIY